MSDTNSSDPTKLQLRLHEASQLSDEGYWPEAFEILKEEESRFPRDPTLLCMLGIAAAEVDAGGLAYDYFRRCVAEQPTDPYVLVPLGIGLARYDDPDAEGVLRLAALSAPEMPLARLHYGAYLAREGQLELALEELTAARSMDPADGRIARELGAVHILAGRTGQGIDELEHAAGLSDDDAETRLLFGLALVAAGRMDEAAEELYRAAMELTADGEVQLAAALSCAEQGWLEQAWDALARADLAELAADPQLKDEVEEALEAGAEEAGALLADELAPTMLRARLQQHL